MNSKKVRRWTFLAAAGLLSLSAASYPTAKSHAAAVLTVTPSSTGITPLAVHYLGTNSGHISMYRNSGNAAKYLGDSFYNLGRVFFNADLPNSGSSKPATFGADVHDAASFANAKNAVKANIKATYTDSTGTYPYIDWNSAYKAVLDFGDPDMHDMGAGEEIAELKKVGLDAIVVLAPQGHVASIPLMSGNYQDMWEYWKYCFYTSYLLAKYYGVVNYNTLNEPHISPAGITSSQLQDIILTEADAVRAAVQLANPSLTAKIWGPTIDGDDTKGLGHDVLGNAHGKNTDAAIDVYDFHSYNSSADTVKDWINNYARVNAALVGTSQPIALTEFNYHLSYTPGNPSVELPTDALDKMNNVLTSMKLLYTMADNDVYAPVNFKAFRTYRFQQDAADGTLPIAMLKSDENTSEVSAPIKAYYAYRMMNRALNDSGGTHDKIPAAITGDTAGITTFATRSNTDIYVLVLNSDTTAKTNYVVDFSNLWSSGYSGSALVREVSGDGTGTGTMNDDVEGVYTLNASHQITIPSLPAQSAQLVVLHKNQNTPASPTIHTLRQNKGSIGVWWDNFAGVESYNVYRSTSAGGTYTKIAPNVTDAFYADSSAVANQDYYYKITSTNVNGEGTLPANAAGPVRLDSDSSNLPWKVDFEGGSITKMTQIAGTWDDVLDDEDNMIHTHPSSGQTNIAVSSDDASTWDNQYLVSAVNIPNGGYGTSGKFGWVAKYTDLTHYYLFEFDAKGGTGASGTGKLLIKKYDGSGTPTVLAQLDNADASFQNTAADGTSDYRYPVKLMINGDHLDFFVNDELKLSATDSSPLAPGKAGFWATDGMNVRYDGITVAPYFTDDFDSGSAKADWNPKSGTWSVFASTKRYKQADTTISTANVLGDTVGAAEYDSKWQDLNAEALVKFISAPDAASEVRLYARYTDDNNNFTYAVNYTNKQVIVKKVVGGTTTVLGTFDLPSGIDLTDQHLLHIDIQNNRHRVYLDDNLCFDQDVYEPALENGHFGLGSNLASVSFDDVAVNALIK